MRSWPRTIGAVITWFASDAEKHGELPCAPASVLPAPRSCIRAPEFTEVLRGALIGECIRENACHRSQGTGLDHLIFDDFHAGAPEKLAKRPELTVL